MEVDLVQETNLAVRIGALRVEIRGNVQNDDVLLVKEVKILVD